MVNNLYTISEVAKLLNVSIQTLRRWDKAGKLKSFRPHKTSKRYYRKADMDLFLEDIFALAFKWWSNQPLPADPKPEFYCPTNDYFRFRLDKFNKELENAEINVDIPLLTAIAGEIGNNSFDHNLGNWPDVPGIFFTYDLNKRQAVLADRGQGILNTLKRVKPSLQTESEAIQTAFTEILSGRAPETRGNGLKFVRQVILTSSFDLFFQSGNASLRIDKKTNQLQIMDYGVGLIHVHGTLAQITF